MATKGQSVTEGTLRPNLVVVFDNQRRFEFRVQCEVELPNEQQALEIVRRLRSDKPNELGEAKTTVLEIAKHKTTNVSKEIIGAAFDKCIAYLTKHPEPHIDGTLRPNLVVVFDNQRRFEFRVQCEVELPNEQQAMEIVSRLRSNNPNKLGEAKTTVLEIAEHKTTNVSKEIIGAAFDKCMDYLKQHPDPPHP